MNKRTLLAFISAALAAVGTLATDIEGKRIIKQPASVQENSSHSILRSIMNKVKVLAFLFATLAAVSSHAADTNSARRAVNYVIELTANDSDFEGCDALLRDVGDETIINQTTVSNGKAILKGEIDRQALAYIYLSNNELRKNHAISLIIEADTIFVDTEHRYPVKAGSLMERSLECERKFLEAPDSERMSVAKGIIEENIGNGICESFIIAYSELCSPDEWMEIYNILDDSTKQLSMVQGIDERMCRLRNTWIGQPFAELKGKNIDGSEAYLSDYVGKGKYVLVDFWASWCKPCIEIGELYIRPFYEKYKDSEDFMILGVAVSDSVQSSIKAAEAHGFSWPQLLGCRAKPFGKYSFISIPQLLLIDPEGKIAARNIDPTKLDNLIADHLDKWQCN